MKAVIASVIGNQSPRNPQPGASAYEIAVANGFIGTQADWLLWLSGKKLITVASAGGVTTLDCSQGNNFYTELTENTTIAVINPPATGEVQVLTLEIKQHASEAKTVTFLAGWAWPDGTDGVVSTTLSAVDELNLAIRNPAGTPLYRAFLANRIG